MLESPVACEVAVMRVPMSHQHRPGVTETNEVSAMRVNDKRIAGWLYISLPTLYRWRTAGLLPRNPRTHHEAQERLARIGIAREKAIFSRIPGKPGRTSLSAIAALLEEDEQGCGNHGKYKNPAPLVAASAFTSQFPVVSLPA